MSAISNSVAIDDDGGSPGEYLRVAMSSPAGKKTRRRSSERPSSDPHQSSGGGDASDAFALLLGACESALNQNRRLARAHASLKSVNATLQQQLVQKTAQLEKRDRELKLLQDQLHHANKMGELGLLASGIAHDFNNILAAIGGNVELAMGDHPTGVTRESLDRIQSAFGRARDLVARILKFSRREDDERQGVAVKPIVDDTVALLRASLPPNVAVRAVCEPNLPLISAVASQIHQVIMNLCVNGAHAIGTNEGALTLDLSRATVNALNAPSPDVAPGPYLRVTITDTGAGMSSELLTQIFEPFFTTKGNAGTGLGMAIVQEIVHDHGGAIVVESEVGHGTTVRLFFPEAECAALPVFETPCETTSRGNGQHVMYVDDEQPLVFIATRLIQAIGYRCTGFSDPREALQAFRANPNGFDALITDLTMPGMSGAELARAVMAIRADVPVAIASGNGAEQIGTDIDGVRRKITKPAGTLEFGSALGEMLRGAECGSAT